MSFNFMVAWCLVGIVGIYLSVVFFVNTVEFVRWLL